MEKRTLSLVKFDEVPRETIVVRLNEEIPSEKYITANELLPNPFKKIKKMNHQPYDHSYNRNIMINCVNDDCLAQIFMFLPVCERPKLALVCKQWKRALRNAWYDVKELELIYWRYDEQPNCLAKYSTSDGGYCFLKSLLNKCGRFLTKLDVTAYDNCNIMPVINEFCPNLITLRLRFTNMDEHVLINSFTRLSKLKSLTIIFQNMELFELLPSAALIDSLRNVANTLTDLNLFNWIDYFQNIPDFTEIINNVIRDLKVLKFFEIVGIRLCKTLFHHLAENGIVCFNHTYHMAKSLCRSDPFINIKKLSIKKCPTTDETLYSIANICKQLEILNINSRKITDAGVAAISKMNNLVFADFIGMSNITDSSVKLLKNLIFLGVLTSNNITDDSIIQVLENSPKMKALGVYSTNVTAELVKKVAEISKRREQHLVLFFPSMPNIKQYESVYFELREIRKKNEKLFIDPSAHQKGEQKSHELIL